VVNTDPADWSSFNNLGNCYNALGDFPSAVEALQAALALEPSSQAIRINLGNTNFQGGDPVTGEMVLRDAAERDPLDPNPLRALFDNLSKSARDDEALEAIKGAVDRDPADPLIQAEYARQASKLNFYPESDAAYRAALKLQADLPEAYVGLASNLERTNHEHLLDHLRDEAERAEAEPAVLDFIDALRFKRADSYEDALAALDRAGDVGKSGRSHHLRGVLLDRLKRFDEAFATFSEMNAATVDHPSEPRGRARIYSEMVAQSSDLISPAWFESWTPSAAPDWRKAPIFIGSFPRSGTTLLDTMLMSDERVIVLEEQPYIPQMQADAGGLESLAKMSQAELLAARETYWAHVAKHGQLGADSVVIDKQPLHTNNVPAIVRLFPEARFIFAMRHPCDVLLSCFLTNFRTNHAMANFLDLEDGARLYEATMTHWEKARKVFDLQVQTVVYERLVLDTPRELRPLFAWLGLEWPGDDLDHREAARARGVVHTASYAQVTEPIYSRAMGRWHNYAAHLAPVLERLRPWVDKFGYSLEDGRIPGWPAAGDA
jgi:tetratricopeptide (TPR) repeat protein